MSKTSEKIGRYCIGSFVALFVVLIVSCEDKPKDLEKAQEQTKVSIIDTLDLEISKKPNDPMLYLYRAQAYINRSMFKEAGEDFKRCARIDSTFDVLYEMRAGFWLKQNEYTNAKEDILKCIELNDENSACHIEKAKLELLNGFYDVAIKDIDNALRVNKHNAEAYFQKGRAFELKGDTSRAVSSYTTAIEDDPDHYFAYMQIALMYTADLEDLALEYYNTALELKPESIEALINKAIFLKDTGFRDSLRYDKAIDLYRKAEKIQPINHIPNYHMGYIYSEYKNEMDSAILEFTNSIGKNVNDYTAYYSRAICHERLDQNDAALEDLNESLRLAPTYTLAALAKDRILNKINS